MRVIIIVIVAAMPTGRIQRFAGECHPDHSRISDFRKANASKHKAMSHERMVKRTDPPDAPSPPALPTHPVAHDADGAPKPKAQRNFTNPGSRIMKQGSDFQQAYNCQNAGATPAVMSADAG